MIYLSVCSGIEAVSVAWELYNRKQYGGSGNAVDWRKD